MYQNTSKNGSITETRRQEKSGIGGAADEVSEAGVELQQSGECAEAPRGLVEGRVAAPLGLVTHWATFQERKKSHPVTTSVGGISKSMGKGMQKFWEPLAPNQQLSHRGGFFSPPPPTTPPKKKQPVPGGGVSAMLSEVAKACVGEVKPRHGAHLRRKKRHV